MSDPDERPPGAPIHIGIDVQTIGPRMALVQFAIQTPFNFYSFGLPPNVAEEFGQNLPQLVSDAVKKARRIESGLIVPGKE